jgi:hypothetical protein
MTALRAYRDPLVPDVDVTVRDQWISNAAYAEMVQKSIIACTDTVMVLAGDDKAIYLGERSTFPMKGVWCLGGRIFFNDSTFESSIARCVYLETGCRFDPARFKYVATHLYSWVKTAQGDFPGKNLAPLFKLEVTPEELQQMAHGLKSEEYNRSFGLQRFDRTILIDERVHPAMLDAFDDIFGT